MRTGHLFAGGGGGLYADLILGHTPIFAVEWNAYACAILRSRALDGWFPGLQVHECDARLFDPSEYTGQVDCIHAGFPCQDISTAGKGAGIHGERSGLYREVLRIAGIIRPHFLFLENTAAIVARGLGTILGDLAQLGYDAKWTILAASEIGAPHQRDRWWCLCTYANSAGQQSSQGAIQEPEQRHDTWRLRPGLADTISGKLQRWGEIGIMGSPEEKNEREIGERKWIRDAAGDSSTKMANANQIGWPRRAGLQGERRRGELENCGNTDVSQPSGEGLEKREGMGQGKSEGPYPAASGSGWWNIEPGFCRLVNGMANRGDQIKCLGNGQVPIQAAAAWKILGGP